MGVLSLTVTEVVVVLLLIPLTSRSRHACAFARNLPEMRERRHLWELGPLSVPSEQCWELEVGRGNSASLPSPSLSRGGDQTENPPFSIVVAILGEK